MLRALSRFLVPVLVCAPLAACGGGGGDDNAPPPEPKPTASAEEFPAAKGKTLPELIQGLPEGPIFAPSVQVLDTGTQRVGFALFDKARKQITGAKVAVYVGRQDGRGARGPFPARSESLAVK